MEVIKFNQQEEYSFEHLEKTIQEYREKMIELYSEKYGISIEEMTEIADDISRQANEHLPDDVFELLRQVQEYGGIKTKRL